MFSITRQINSFTIGPLTYGFSVKDAGDNEYVQDVGSGTLDNPNGNIYTVDQLVKMYSQPSGNTKTFVRLLKLSTSQNDKNIVNYPDGSNRIIWPYGQSKDILNKNVHETINYIDDKGNQLIPPVDNTIQFTRDATYNEYSGQLNYGPWQIVSGTPTSIASPSIENYKLSDSSQSAIQLDVSPNDDNTIVNVVYVYSQKTDAKANLDAEATKVKNDIDNDPTLTQADKDQQKANVDSTKAADQAKIDAATTPDDVKNAYNKGVADIDAQHVPGKTVNDQNNRFKPRRVYMVKGFYRYSSVNFDKKHRIQGYKKHNRPNAVMFSIVGEYKSKNGLFKVDHKKWGYITAKSSYMKPLYYSTNVHKIKVIGKSLRAYKNSELSKYTKSYKRGTVLNVKSVKKIGTTYRFQLANGHYVSANKNLVKFIK